MNQQTIRPYEISLWTLQDSFITVLKPIEGLFQGQIIAPKISLKNDNTQILTFSLPMYYRDKQGELVENPLWYNTRNGNLLVNLRKIKVIFNKGEEGEGVYEFVIHKVTESHSGGQLTCDVEAEGLAFQELGKIGYKITLNYDEFLLDAGDDANFLATLDYWAAKVFKNTNWTYSIQMDWSSYDGVIDLDTENKIVIYENLSDEERDNLNSDRENRGLRRRDTLYEEEYISSWSMDETIKKLVPREMVQFQEKARIPQIEKSNIYNATQDLAELFEVYCKYKYYYDENYHIIKRECIFYNNFLDESTGKFDINYPYHTNDIKRTLESVDVITKMFVEKIEDVSIMDVAANKSREDYILNFDYLYTIGTITQEQYDAIDDYTYQMHLLNTSYDTYFEKLSALDLELVDLKAQHTMLSNSITYDLEQISMADDLIAAIVKNPVIVKKTLQDPDKVNIVADNSGENPVYKINLTTEGIDPKTIKLYTVFSEEQGIDTSSEIVLTESNLMFDAEDTTKLIGLINLPVTTEGPAFLIYDYSVKDARLKKTNLAPERVMVIESKTSEGTIKKINLTLEGIYPETVKLYSGYDTPDGVNTEVTLSQENFEFDKLTGLNLIALTQLDLDTGSAYLTCEYFPKMKYENVKQVYTQKLKEDEDKLKEISARLTEIGIVYENDTFEVAEGGKYNSIEKDLAKIQKDMEYSRSDFERMMGPALREGSWTPEEDYSDSGDRYSQELYFEYNENLVRAFWDEELFDEELKNYYEEGTELSRVYYPAIKLEEVYQSILDNDSDLVLKIAVPYSEEEGTGETYLTIGSQIQYAFLKDESAVHPVLLITEILADAEIENLKTSAFGTVEVKEDGEMEFTEIIALSENSFLDNNENYSIVYPRIEVRSDKLKTTDDEIGLYQNDIQLEKYVHYSLLQRDSWYYLTIKPSAFFTEEIVTEDGEIDLKNNIYTFNYVISNAGLRLYLDALEVSKTNAYPQASYEVSLAAVNPDFLKYSYQKLNKVANINDKDLKFENVQGYISEIDMVLDSPWQDTFVIQNYKTKFEDLFSRIVASSEQMQTNQFAYNRAAAAFSTGGTLSSTIIQNTLNSVDLNYSFNQGELTIDELNGIWATSDAGVVAMRGGGIFCATERDANNNWLWHSGITPSGINASLLQTGIIDTNLIRIYSGENIRFQMNADGLFAYDKEENGNANFNRYVVHNSEGLFLTEKTIVEKEGVETTNQIDLVEVSWDGIIIRNKKNEPVFYADDNGDLVITGILTAKEGATLAGWTINSDSLSAIVTKGDNGPIISSAGMSPSGDITFWAGDIGEDNHNKFYVTKDGTLYASHAFISGTISAGTIVGDLNGGNQTTIGEAVRQLNVISISEGNSFKYSNLNLDGNIILEPEWLRFQIQQKNLKITTWNFEKWDGETKNEDDSENWIPIVDDPNLYFENLQHLTFIVKHGIMYFGDKNNDFVYFRISGTDEYTGQTYSTTFFLTNTYIATDKELSLIDPPSYTFIGSQKQPYPAEQVFKVTLKNLNPEEGNWVIEGELLSEGIMIINGNADVEDEQITREDSSTILIPAENIENGKWYINDILVETGDLITGMDDTISTEIIYNEDGTATAQITIPSSRVPEGDQIIIRYQLGSASRTAFAFKIKNGADTISTQIVSTEGNIFKNGNIETQLTVNLYEGAQLINGEGTAYGYLWEKNGKVLENTLDRIYLNQKTIQVHDNDFEDKAVYTCKVYETEEEARTEYLRYYPSEDNGEQEEETKEE